MQRSNLLFAMVLVAAAACAAPSPAPPPQSTPTQPIPLTAETLPREDFRQPAHTVRHTPLVGEWRISIPTIGVDAPLVAVGLEPDGAMAAPEGPFEVGWYRHGPAPGERGNVLLDGHVDWSDRETGRPFTAVFWALRNLGNGATVRISDGAQEWVYEVTERQRYRFDDPEGVSVLQPTDDARLTMITCGGAFNRATRSYDMRDIVIARLVS